MKKKFVIVHAIARKRKKIHIDALVCMYVLLHVLAYMFIILLLLLVSQIKNFTRTFTFYRQVYTKHTSGRHTRSYKHTTQRQKNRQPKYTKFIPTRTMYMTIIAVLLMPNV